MVNNTDWEAFIIIFKLFLIYYKSARYSNVVIKHSKKYFTRLIFSVGFAVNYGEFLYELWNYVKLCNVDNNRNDQIEYKIDL